MPKALKFSKMLIAGGDPWWGKQDLGKVWV
jgi:hypothetical protein